MKGLETLVDAVVERVDRPLPGLFALSLRLAGERLVVLVASGRSRTTSHAWGVVPKRPRGGAADPEVRGLREKLEGSRVVAAREMGRALGLAVVQNRVSWWVSGTRVGLLVGPPIDGNTPPGVPLASAAILDARTRGVSFIDEHRRLLVEDARRAATAKLKKLRERLERRVVAITRDIAAASHWDAKARRAQLFVAAAAGAPAGATELSATDWSSGVGVAVTFALDEAKRAQPQLELVFAKAKRLRTGARIAERRGVEAERGLTAIDRAAEALQGAIDGGDVQRILTALTPELPADVRLVGRDPVRPARGDAPLPRGPREFRSRTGVTFFVGKDARANDALTVSARPGDLWLHARGRPGAHVIVPRWFRAASADQGTLLDAATLAAHFSDERGEVTVDVAYADKRHVQKRRGSPPGAVFVTEERVIAIRVEPARLAALLASEQR